LLELKGKTAGFLRNTSALLGRNLQEIEAPLARLTEYSGALDALNVNYEVDITSGRGFEYYTGVIFQVWVSGQRVGGGGRYDALIDLLGGSDTAACGFALFLDKLADLIPNTAGSETASNKVAVLARPDPGSLREAYELVGALHKAGHIAGVHTGETERAGVTWHLDIAETGPRFVLRDAAGRRHFKASSVDEILSLLKTHRAKR
jgi:histidyl-tRNA synthetase